MVCVCVCVSSGECFQEHWPTSLQLAEGGNRGRKGGRKARSMLCISHNTAGAGGQDTMEPVTQIENTTVLQCKAMISQCIISLYLFFSFYFSLFLSCITSLFLSVSPYLLPSFSMYLPLSLLLSGSLSLSLLLSGSCHVKTVHVISGPLVIRHFDTFLSPPND